MIDDIENEIEQGLNQVIRDRELRNCFYMFGIKTALLQLFHEPKITHMFKKRIMNFLKLTKLLRK